MLNWSDRHVIEVPYKFVRANEELFEGVELALKAPTDMVYVIGTLDQLMPIQQEQGIEITPSALEVIAERNKG